MYKRGERSDDFSKLLLINHKLSLDQFFFLNISLRKRIFKFTRGLIYFYSRVVI